MGCSGMCCKEFYLPLRMEDLQKRTEMNGSKKEAEFIKDMVIWLRDISHEKPKLGEDPTDSKLYSGAIYTCRHWDKLTKLCTVYDKRPMMCRDFPYGKQCMMDTNCNEPGNTRTTLKYEASLFY